jgi:2,3-bisphosphoglycerate-dependent phosphoglycerate mutase
MELLLIRHAQPAWVDADGLAYNDPPLTELGRAQAAALAAHLAATPVDELHVSSAVRSRETAAPVAERLGLDPSVHEELFELRLPPDLDGSPVDAVRERFAGMRWRPREEWWDGLPGGGEPFGDFHARVTTHVEGLLRERGAERDPTDPQHVWQLTEPDDTRRLALVTHAGTTSVIVSHLLGIDPTPWEWERFSSNHAAVSVLRTTRISSGWIWSLQHFSDVSFLPPEMVTD